MGHDYKYAHTYACDIYYAHKLVIIKTCFLIEVEKKEKILMIQIYILIE